MTALSLRADAHFTTARVVADPKAFTEHVEFDGVSWFHVTGRGKRWLLHGSVMSSGSALYVFMEHPEARHQYGEAGPPLVRERFSVDVVNRSYLALYDRITTR